MGVSVLPYHKVTEVAGLLDSIKLPNRKIIVPSSADKSWLSSKNNSELWTWDEIYKDVCESGRVKRKRVLSPPDHLLILDSILKNVLAEYSEKVRKLPGLMRLGFLSIISTDIRELLTEAVRPEQLDYNPESDNASEFILPEVYSRYIKYLEQYNLLDSAEIYSEALKEIIKNQAWGRGFAIVFCGFLSFTHAQLELVETLADRCEEVVILKPETNLKKFYDADLQLRGVNAETKRTIGKIVKIPVAEPDLEPEVIARTLAIKAQKDFDFDDAGLMIANGREKTFAEAFDRYGVPYDFVSGVRINLTLPGKILSSIRHLNSRGFPAYETAMLLTQPCFAGSKFPVMQAYRAGPSGLDNWREYLRVRSEELGVRSENPTGLSGHLPLKGEAGTTLGTQNLSSPLSRGETG
ncbi:MAG: hypothetical protein IJU31_03390, partial [Synergistaceae bacterium]|nr:hypothetical protein [Synergistaceae bacterium]